ncbi:MAG: hypothetical protein AAF384_04375 [Pseudomonadota bacterium]
MSFSLKSIFNRNDSRVLFVAADQATYYIYNDGELANSYGFTTDEAGLALFERCLVDTGNAPVSILVDMVEEEYRLDTMPHVGGGDRKSVLDRKFARLFRGTPYYYAERQGRETEGRKDDKVLLAALTKPESVQPWVEKLMEVEMPIAGIYSLPVLSAQLLKTLKVNAENVLLVSLQSISGLRQSFFRGGQLRISRLAYMPRMGSVPYANYMLDELEKLRRYLNSLALVAREQPLHIYILSHGDLLNELEQHCRDTEDEKFFLVDVAEVEVKLGENKTHDRYESDALFARLLTGASVKNHYAKPEETQAYQMHKTRDGLLVAGALLLLGGLIWSAVNFVDAVTLRQQALDARQKAVFYQERYQLARQKLPPTPVEPRDIKHAVDVVDSLREQKASPVGIMATISQAIARTPEVRLDRMEWSTEFPEQKEVSRTALALDIPAYDRYDHAELKGRIEPFSGNFREAIATIDGLVEELELLPDIEEVTVLEYPLDVSSDSDVSGSATDSQERQTAEFRLKVVKGASNGQQS